MRIIEVDDNDRALVTGFVAREETRRRMQRDRENFRENVSRYRGREYVDRFENRSRSLDIDELARRSISIGRQMQSIFRDDSIFDMWNIGDFQHASERMKHYMLSDPTINYRARNQRCEAWGKSINDYAYRSNDYSSNPYYRAMNHGMMQESEDGKSMFTINYLDMSDVEQLSYDEQRSLLRNKNLLIELLGNYNEEDPTSPSNNLL